MAGPEVAFYVLPGGDGHARLRFACRLVEKAWAQRRRVRVQLDPGGELEVFDQLLWTFSDRSFVPHRRAGNGGGAPAPALPEVVIADTPDGDADDGDVLVNLACALPPRFDAFGRVAEIVDADPERRRLGRERFRLYRDRGIEPVTHDMRSEA